MITKLKQYAQSKMNHDVKIRWLEALRSNKYRQGTGTLRTLEGKFCCLGVLCDLYSPEEWKNFSGYANYSYGTINEPAVLIPSVCDWAGLDFDSSQGDPTLPVEAIAKDPRWLSFIAQNPGRKDLKVISLSMLNDNGFSFQEIANLIERYL
jgi:hypothetical protein